ncbi:hypothetical protein F5Y09DRAFT_205811 [Xylaria sp. FL1042]|nr:hypothetical protein F5Y09DRAFT_205811 [Xylaria sp. FL1042]
MAFDSGSPDQYPIHLGTWTNWSRGRVLGFTLTLGRQEANLLIAFTAFFIAFVATRFWRVLCFAFHQLYATSTSQNVIYHQRQAILRNSSTPEGGIQQLVQLIWANRHSDDRFAPLLVVIVAFLSITAFTVAGGLSSQISNAVGTEVLLQSRNCGTLDGDISDSQIFFALAPTQAQLVDNAANYAQQCYSANAGGNLDCGRFVTQKLTSIVDDDAPCPFERKICRSNSNIRVDSGYIDSREHLGINRPERFFARNVLHCAPITTTGYTSQRNTSIGNYTVYHYGSIMAPAGRRDYVFAAESIESQYALTFSPDFPTYSGDYGISSVVYQLRNKTVVTSASDFIPISPLLKEDADVILVFLTGNGVVYSAPSTDEWYRVSPTPVGVNSDNAAGSSTAAIYLPLEPSSPLACTDQYQFCHGDIQHCGELANIADARSSIARLLNATAVYNNYNDTAQVPLKYFLAGITEFQFSPLWEVLSQLGPASLASKSSLTAALQGPLPPNQWKLDVTRWSDITRASLQASYLGISYFNDQSLLKYRTNFTSQSLRTLCNNQKIRSTAYTSFSVFGLLFTFIIGFLIVLILYLLEPKQS